MEGFLDIYSRLIIAFISFTAPLITFLLSVTSNDILKFKQKSLEKKRQILKVLEMPNTLYNNDNAALKLYNENIKKLMADDTLLTKKLNLLNPKRQILRLFISLLFSLGFLMIYKIVKDKSFCIYSHWLAVTLLVMSLVCLIFSLFVFQQVAWATIDAKTDSLASPTVTLGSE